MQKIKAGDRVHVEFDGFVWINSGEADIILVGVPAGSLGQPVFVAAVHRDHVRVIDEAELESKADHDLLTRQDELWFPRLTS